MCGAWTRSPLRHTASHVTPLASSAHSSVEAPSKRTSPEERRHAEVGYLDVVLLVEQQVLGLDVAVRDAAAVQVLQPGEQLAPVAARLRLAHAHVGLDAVEELAARRVLQEHVVLARVHALAQAAQHVRVAQRAVQRGLARGRGLRLRARARAAHHLQRHGGARARVHQQPDPARARSEPHCSRRARRRR